MPVPALDCQAPNSHSTAFMEAALTGTAACRSWARLRVHLPIALCMPPASPWPHPPACLQVIPCTKRRPHDWEKCPFAVRSIPNGQGRGLHSSA